MARLRRFTTAGGLGSTYGLGFGRVWRLAFGHQSTQSMYRRLFGSAVAVLVEQRE